MSICLDTTALRARHIDDDHRMLILDAMSMDHRWWASAMALTEAMMLVDRLDLDHDHRDRLGRQLRRDWDRLHRVPVDEECLSLATRLGRDQPLRITDAIHLAAAQRLPGPVSFATFDPNQIGPALALGFEVISPMSL